MNRRPLLGVPWRNFMRSLRSLVSRRWIVLLALPALTPAQGQKQAGKGIAADTVAAYEKLGAIYGSFDNGHLGMGFVPGKVAAESSLPTFCFPGDLPPNLPDAGVPFGIWAGYYGSGNRPDHGFLPANAGNSG